MGGAGSEGQLWVGMRGRIEGGGGGTAEDESRAYSNPTFSPSAQRVSASLQGTG